jgi:phosphonate utilization associated putative membrane protein
MVLTWPVILAVLFGALLHASWNALVKSSTHKDLDMAVIHLIGSFLAIPLVAWVGWPDAKAWPYIAATVVIHIGYYTALTGAYQHGDLGLTYPLMRGLAPLLVALSATFTVGESLSAVAWLGVLGVSCGVLVLGLSSHARAAPKAIAFALTNAVIIAAYTVVDALGVRASGNPVQYISTLFLFAGWPFALMMFARHGRVMTQYAQKRWPLATIGAAASLASYGIALWAMTRAPVATIAALRETSVLFAVFLGAWFLKEAFTVRRVVGTGVIVAGVMALRLG